MIELNTLIEWIFSDFFLSSFIYLLMFLFKITFSNVSLFLLSTFSFKSGYFSENFVFTWSSLSINLSFAKSNGAFSVYYFKKITSSFLNFWFWFIWFTIKLFNECMLSRVRGILKLVLWRFFFFSTFFLKLFS